MAEGKSGRRSSGASKNDTPNTPEVAESKIARMKVDELRKQLKQRGVGETAKLRKDDLVKKLIKLERADAKAGSSTSSSSGSAKKSTAGQRKSRNETPNTPEVEESKVARIKVDELRQRLEKRGVQDVGKLRKGDLVKMLVKAYVADAAKKSDAKKSDAKKAATKKSDAGNKSDSKQSAGKKSDSKKKTTAGAASRKSVDSKAGSGGIRTGKQSSRSLKYSQEVTSVQDEPERPGRSLVTTDHEVIRRWAEARKAAPATIDGTEHDDHLGVLRFDFPGGSSGGRLRQVEWDEWLGTFDKRRLNFIYQEERTDGRQSNFFRLESPDREDA